MMNDFFKEWAPLLAIILAPTFGIVAARWNRKSQVEANNLTGTGQIFTQQSNLLQDVQEERLHAKQEIATLRADFEAFKLSVKAQFSGYKAYIHGLRGQVDDLGGVPIEWPKDLEQ